MQTPDYSIVHGQQHQQQQQQEVQLQQQHQELLQHRNSQWGKHDAENVSENSKECVLEAGNYLYL